MWGKEEGLEFCHSPTMAWKLFLLNSTTLKQRKNKPTNTHLPPILPSTYLGSLPSFPGGLAWPFPQRKRITNFLQKEETSYPALFGFRVTPTE